MTEATPPVSLHRLNFSDIDGWCADDHRAALAAFQRGAGVLADHPPKRREIGVDPAALSAIIRQAAALPEDIAADAARTFFEAHFAPYEIEAPDAGHFTGYYEPVLTASRERTDTHAVPFLRRPDDLVEIEPGTGVPALAPDVRFARSTPGGLEPYPDRGAIMAGALNNNDLALCYVADPVDAFFVHIQGAARLHLTDGTVMRITYDGKSGHAYTPIGRTLIEMGALERGNVTMQTIRAWLADHPDERDAVLASNRSYIFFRETAVLDPGLGPVAAAKVPLTPGRSLAVDRLLYSFHVPVWIESTLPGGEPLRRLMIAQDTGSAIVGPARGDVFFGSGDGAAETAGAMNARGRFVLLMAKAD